MNSNNNTRFQFLGLNFHNVTFNDAILKLEDFIATKNPHMIFTTGAELVVRANQNPRLKDVYNSADLLVIDSFILCYAAKLVGKSIKEPVNATRLMKSFLEVIHRKGYRVYLLGATEDSLNKAIENIKMKYPGINIAGWHHGYFDFDNDMDVVLDIIEKKPDILFVAMSSPLKENFIARNAQKIQVPVCMGVGGSVDVLSGKCRLAPLWLSRLGLEWFYRLIQEPRRLWKRYLVTNSIFVWLVLKEIFGYEKSSSG